ncbi:transposase [Micrococcus luteus]|nr:transposase [Micrococcus luteus]
MSRFEMLSDAQWELIAPMLPAPPNRPGGPAIRRCPHDGVTSEIAYRPRPFGNSTPSAVTALTPPGAVSARSTRNTDPFSSTPRASATSTSATSTSGAVTPRPPAPTPAAAGSAPAWRPSAGRR